MSLYTKSQIHGNIYIVAMNAHTHKNQWKMEITDIISNVLKHYMLTNIYWCQENIHNNKFGDR